MAGHGSINRTVERAAGGANGGLVLLIILGLLGAGIWSVTKIETSAASFRAFSALS